MGEIHVFRLRADTELSRSGQNSKIREKMGFGENFLPPPSEGARFQFIFIKSTFKVNSMYFKLFSVYFS